MTAGTWRSIAVLAGLAAIGLAVPAVRHLRDQPPRLPLRLILPDIPGTEPGSGDEALDAAISPDEQHLLLVATTEGVARLWRRPLAGDRAEPLAGTDGARFPTWSPAGDAVTFFAGNELRQLRLSDGAATTLAKAPAPAGATWLPDGTLLFATGDGPIQRLTGGTSAPATTLRPGERRHEFPVATGRDTEFVYVAVGGDNRRIARLVSADDDRQLVQTSGHAQMIGDRLLFVRDNVLLTQRFDRDRRRLAGNAAPLIVDVGVGASGKGLFAASPRLLISAGAATPPRDILWIDAGDGRRLHSANAPADYWQVRVSPDDRQIAVTQAAPLLRTLDVYRLPAEGGTPVSLSTSIFADTDPVWSTDGSRLIFRSLHGGRPQLLTRPVLPIEADAAPLRDGSPLDGDAVPTDWAGSFLLLHRTSPGSGADVLRLDLRSGDVAAVASSSFNEHDARWSPDTGWIAYVSDERGEPDVYVRPWPLGASKRVSFGGGTRPRWGHDGRTLFFQRGDQIMRLTRTTGDAFTSAVPVARLTGLRDFDATSRSPRLVVLATPDSAVAPPISVAVDWMH